VIDSLFTLSDL